MSESSVFGIFGLGDGMFSNFSFVLIDSFFDHLGSVSDRVYLVLLLLNFAFPVSLNGLVFLFLDPQLLIKCKYLVSKLLLLILHQVLVRLEGGALVFNYSLGLFDLLHVVLHLSLEVILKEAEKILLNVNFLNLFVDSLELAVHFRIFHFAQSSKLTSHLDDFVFF